MEEINGIQFDLDGVMWTQSNSITRYGIAKGSDNNMYAIRYVTLTGNYVLTLLP